jgi:hypothetical protein
MTLIPGNTRICRAQDPDDPIYGRICGRPSPCPDHPRGWKGKRSRSGSRIREQAMFSLSSEARDRLREMAEEQGRPVSRVLEDLILARRS